VHRDGDEVRVYSRSLHDVTDRVPELVAAVRAMPARSLILDGEAIALQSDGSPHRFQTTMRRFGRGKGPRRSGPTAAELPLSSLLFDCLYVDGASLLALPARARHETLARLVPPAMLPQRIVTADLETAEAFYDATVAAGHEGLMAKSLEAPYEAGSRGFSWLKLKPAHTLDLVVLAVERGSGRRTGMLSNLHLGARGPDGTFVMLGKTFKGMTDANPRLADGDVRQARDRGRRLGRARAARGRRGDRAQRRAVEPALSGRAGAPLRAREALPRGQARRGRRHDRDRARPLRARPQEKMTRAQIKSDMQPNCTFSPVPVAVSSVCAKVAGGGAEDHLRRHALVVVVRRPAPCRRRPC